MGTESQRLAAQYRGRRPAGSSDLKELDEFLAHVSPAHSENINFLAVEVDIDAEFAHRGPTRYRPLWDSRGHAVLVDDSASRTTILLRDTESASC
ncbi:MAG: hypothetical protein L0K86_02850 [Actinomycetia bacterium]|nr:hypothetical protein [Actinomycetes bacterium]